MLKFKKIIKDTFLWKTLGWRIWRFFRKLRPSDYESYKALYERVVVGGVVEVKPLNLKGVFRISARSDLAKRVIITNNYESDVVAVIEDILKGRAGDVINIGANVGLLAIHMKLAVPGVDRVFAIEPNPAAFDLLVENIRINNLVDGVIAINKCISDERKRTVLAVIPGMPEYSSLNGIDHLQVDSAGQISVPVETERLEFVLPVDAKPMFVLIDVEGAEFWVLKGGLAILKKWKPVLIMELSSRLLSKNGHTIAEVVGLLSSVGYNVVDAFDRNRLSSDFDGEAIAIPDL